MHQLDADIARLGTLRERIVRDTEQLKQRVADMSRDLDQQTGGKTFSKMTADVGIVNDVIAKIEPYTTACRRLQAATAAAATAASAAGRVPSGGISRLFGFGASTAYDPSSLVAELTGYGKKQDAEIQDAGGRGDQARFLLTQLQSRLDQAYASAADGARDSQSPIVPTPH